MKKNNSKVSQKKIKRFLKNKKRLSEKIKLSSFEKKQATIRQTILNESINRMSAQPSND
jgi:hypothetical protein